MRPTNNIERPSDLEADAAGGTSNDACDAIERWQWEWILKMTCNDPLKEKFRNDVVPSSEPF